MAYSWKILKSAVEQKILFPTESIYLKYLEKLDKSRAQYEILMESLLPKDEIIAIIRKSYNNNAYLSREDSYQESTIPETIHKTANYFGMTMEEASVVLESGITVEKARILELGTIFHFLPSYERLLHMYNDSYFQMHIEEHGYEMLIFEFVSDNTLPSKYCIVLK